MPHSRPTRIACALALGMVLMAVHAHALTPQVIGPAAQEHDGGNAPVGGNHFGDGFVALHTSAVNSA